jgi:CubicO group peptidase (beta-lactamase class C family)
MTQRSGSTGYRPARRLVAMLALAATCAFTAAAGAATSPTTSGDAERVAAWLDARVPDRMREAKLPGWSIAVVRDGSTVYAGAFGARDSARGLPATADTLFGIGSVTKSFVAIAILQLVDDGRVRLDDPVSKFVPLELGMRGRPITIHHLLTHTAGFPNLDSSNVLISRGLGRDTGVPMASAADFYRFVNGAADEVRFAPGERYFYSNESWRMLGHVVQVASGQPFHRYVTERILEPLGMTRTTFRPSQVRADPDHLTPHRVGENGAEPTDLPYPDPEDNLDFAFLSAAGGLFSSAREMASYLGAQIAGGRHAGGRLASEDAFARMQAEQIRIGEDLFGAVGYGYGLRVNEDFLGQRLLSHGGSISVSTAHLAFVPALGIGVVMMGNGPGFDYETLSHEVLALLMGHDPEVVLPGAAIERRMDRLVGEYAIYGGLSTMTVTHRDGMLYLGSASGGDVPLVPEDRTYANGRFRILRDGRESVVEFVDDEDGGVSAIVDRNVFHKRD